MYWGGMSVPPESAQRPPPPNWQVIVSLSDDSCPTQIEPFATLVIR